MRYAIPVMLCMAIAFMVFQDREASQAHSSPSIVKTSAVDADRLLEIASYVQVQTQLLERNTDILGNIERSITAMDEAQRAAKFENQKSILVSDPDKTPEEAPPAPKPKAEATAEDYQSMHDYLTPKKVPKVKAEGDGCDCASQFQTINARLDALESSRYGSVSSSGGGSTGKVKSGGSTGKPPMASTVTTTTYSYGPPPVSSSGGGSSGSLSKPAAPRFNTPLRDALYRPRWTNKDGLSLNDHIALVHGLSSPQEHDAYHDAFGPDHPWQNNPTPMQSPAPVMLGPVTQAPCPGGYQTATGEWVCPNKRTNYVQQSSQNTGWYPGKNLGRKR